MQSLPHPATIATYIPENERYAQSRSLEWHNKGLDGPRRIATYLNDTLRTPADLKGYIYATQFVQAEAVAAGLRGWRRRWQGTGGDVVGGVLIWQLNACWPATSWAIVDYALRPKPAYYVVRRTLAPVTIEIARRSPTLVELWATTNMAVSGTFELFVTVWTLDGTQVEKQSRPVTLVANGATELGELTSSDTVISTQLLRDGVIIARAALWPEPFKYLSVHDPEITIQRVDTEHVRVHTRRPAKGVWLSAGDDTTWSDNMLDLFPHDPQLIQVDAPPEQEIHIQHLGNY